MNVIKINELLFNGKTDIPGIFPHLDDLKNSEFIFDFDFGLQSLPEEPGIIVIRGGRQFGKSTWIELQLKKTVADYGGGTAFYLNGDEIGELDALINEIRMLIPLFNSAAKVRRIFIDEITAVKNWQKAVKILADAGELRSVLLVTTGSKATDLRTGTERLPGRKGRLERSTFIFTPVSYREFKTKCGERLRDKTLIAYILSGGVPFACNQIASTGRIPEYVVDTVKDWIYGECSLSGRNRSSLKAVLDCIYKYACNPCGQAKISRESGLANNTVAAGYIELLMNLMCISSSFHYDPSKGVPLRRKPCRYNFTNLLAALAWHPSKIRSVDEFMLLTNEDKGVWYEWMVAQELWRRSAMKGEESPEESLYWRGDEHEVDFITNDRQFIEVKHGRTTPIEFSWFRNIFPGSGLKVISSSEYSTPSVLSCTMENFLLESEQ